MQCSYCSDKLDPFLDLSLEIAKANSLNKALVNFTAEEQLDGGERQYQCQRCNQKVRAMKQMTIHKPPSVLTIHLKRFRAHDPGQKINKEVQFSPTLDLRPFVSGAFVSTLPSLQACLFLICSVILSMELFVPYLSQHGSIFIHSYVLLGRKEI